MGIFQARTAQSGRTSAYVQPRERSRPRTSQGRLYISQKLSELPRRERNFGKGVGSMRPSRQPIAQTIVPSCWTSDAMTKDVHRSCLVGRASEPATFPRRASGRRLSVSRFGSRSNWTGQVREVAMDAVALSQNSSRPSPLQRRIEGTQIRRNNGEIPTKIKEITNLAAGFESL